MVNERNVCEMSWKIHESFAVPHEITVRVQKIHERSAMRCMLVAIALHPGPTCNAPLHWACAVPRRTGKATQILPFNKPGACGGAAVRQRQRSEGAPGGEGNVSP
jgi:hypothetical protein